ncbi:TPA: type IV secretory system conjugative DNA transfer family protein [Clostridioides difficile]|uniref:VirD4-like conjugal transfer protein, CD1115 family n=1 Tax=Clostridioides difficile TaxID=1496 RepID=UPI0010B477F3|nr:type IV secretory system conjugative DNA transfer family protein [Clostridioides difficile]MDC9466114.1 type IV secretory system conjugative DNA transfer family protein [Clostridioides difficile]VIH56671.1 conjugative transfer protein Tn1549-like, CTn2-Orf5 [Clostridioides difficile]HBF2730992.1 type IV secretory system conjugative DNA transfer family protein [Clostridioides difficile]HBG7959512.1 type IV secretory system conjugative DNA transfer family protein [Clostridioides difficile]HBG
MKQDDKQSAVILSVIGILPVVWLALLIAPSVKGGLPEILPKLMTVFNNPFHIELCEDSLKTVLVLLLCYGFGIGIYFSTRRNYRRREEHGSAKWGNARAVNKKYCQTPKSENKLMTQNVSIGLNAKKHRRNLNTLVCGGSGAGKTRFYCKPNLMQCNSSFVILDPKGEIVRDVGKLLEAKGYEIKVLDLISMEKSHCYNPFVYLQNDNDIQRLVTNLFKSTTPKGSQSNDPFWDTAASMLLLALVFYLHYEAPEDEQNFAMIMEMLRAGAIEDEEEPRPSPLDNLFSELEYENPDHIALKYYHSYHSGSAKTLKSIQITLAARLEKFNLESLASLTSTDELELETLGEKKTALFALIPDNDTSFNFLVSILYTQLFQQLFYSADHIHGGSLPIPVHFLMDEFANVSLPDDFDKILSVMRSRSVSVSIILQNLAQLKALFEKQWESIVGNCDEFLYLGGNEQSTHKYVSELLGKSTIDTNTYGKSEGRSGSYSTNYQISGRELLTPDEVRMLDNRYAILFIRGERPVLDFKYDILKHPNVALTADGKAGVYEHGEVKSDVATIELLSFDKYKAPETEVAETNYELLSDEDFEND